MVSIRPIEALFLILIAILSCGGMYLILFPSPPGYCSTQQRFLTDEEYILRALYSERDRGYLNQTQPDNPIERHLKENPGCCSVSRPKQPTVLERLYDPQVKFLGTAPVTVHLNYEMSDREKQRTGAQFYESFLELNGCGDLERQYGESHNKEKFK